MNLKFWKKVLPIAQDGFTHIYADALGNKWYAIANPANIHATRALTAWTYSRDAEYGLTKEQRTIGYAKMNEALNKKDISSLAKILGVFEAAEDLYATPNILLNLATCYTFLNDEKNDSYKDFIQQKKRDIWDSDPVCKSFFFAMVSSVHAATFAIAERECPRIFGTGKAGARPDRFPTAEEVVESRVKFTKDINKINERVSLLSGRNPDDNLNKCWGDWLTTVETVLEIEEQKQKKRSKR